MTVLNELDRHLLTWVGTFGRTGMPTLKYKLGVDRGITTISTVSPKIRGVTMDRALEVAEKICVEFEVRVGATGDLVRATADAPNWIDLDDWALGGLVTRIFTKLADRIDKGDVQLLRAARKAYFLQNWDEASAKFERLGQTLTIRGLASTYQQRIDYLRTQPKDPHWDGVFRKTE